MAEVLAAASIPVTLILDAAVAYMMERVDLVVVGADGVVESGGIMNTLGTYQVAVVAKAMNKPVYVAAESYKVWICVMHVYVFGWGWEIGSWVGKVLGFLGFLDFWVL